MEKNKKIIISVILILLLCGIWAKQNIFERTSAQVDAPSKVIEEPADMRDEAENVLPANTAAKTAAKKITVIAGDARTQLSVLPNTIFYDALVEAKDKGKIEFSGKNYPSLGFFVTDIGTLHSGNGKDLIYYINGKEAAVGVSSYTLKDGDVIEWKLE